MRVYIYIYIHVFSTVYMCTCYLYIYLAERQVLSEECPLGRRQHADIYIYIYSTVYIRTWYLYTYLVERQVLLEECPLGRRQQRRLVLAARLLLLHLLGDPNRLHNTGGGVLGESTAAEAVNGMQAFTRYSFTPKCSCTSQSSFYCPLHLHCSHYCNTIARLMRNIGPPPDPSFLCHTPLNIGSGNIV